jgi:DNA invertase Pin-like site-specific DNA recombinase
MIYGYLRISTDQQDINTCRNEIIKKCTDIGEDSTVIVWIEETLSGSICYKKRKLGEFFNTMFRGDIIIASELSRIGRRILDIMQFMSVAQERGIKIYFAKTDFKCDGSIESNMMIFSYALSSQIERELISQRTKEALKQKKNNGVILGRPRNKSKLDDYKNEIKQKYQLGVSQKKLAEDYNVNKMTINKFINKYFKKNIVEKVYE